MHRTLRHAFNLPMRLRTLPLSLLVLVPMAHGRSNQAGRRIVAAARRQIGVTVRYVPDYQRISYPNGDVPSEQGVCTDVVVRALRSACGSDLQQLVHEDMKAHFAKYPTNWGRKTPDPNIDHRRVPNLRVFFKRRGWSLPPKSPFLPGDLVTCTLPSNRDHIMIVSDRIGKSRWPLVIHNIGQGAKEEDCLGLFAITGHYRVR
jgi:uncharacterized protein YijF (DUF1287 family)